jgi:hypothetical protein
MYHARLTGSGSSNGDELELFQSLLDNYHDSEFPFAVASEWEFRPGFTHHGRGDLVSAVEYDTQHEACRVLVVEVKNLDSGSGPTAKKSRNHARKKVEEQMQASMNGWSKLHPNEEVNGAVYTSENHRHMDDAQTNEKVGLGYLAKLG